MVIMQEVQTAVGLGMGVAALAMAEVIVETEGVVMVEVAIVDSQVQIKFQGKTGFIIMSKVLISYSQADSEIADEIVRTLLKQNVEIIRDVRDVSWGESVELKVDKGFDEISAVLVIISPASLKSQWMPYEIGFIRGKEKAVIPYITDPSLELPADVQRLNCINEIGQLQAYFAA
jgi:hypothetical protein